MTSMTSFESRKGKVQCTPEEAFTFVTDLRHFRQFVPEGKVETLLLEKESCSFGVPAIGQVNVRLTERKPYQKVLYEGNALNGQKFSLQLEISGLDNGQAEVRVFLDAELNPFLKMIISGPVNQFLETLVKEMEKFTGWKETIT